MTHLPKAEATHDPRTVVEQRFPHIIQTVVSVWKNPDEADQYLNSLIVDDRDSRSGLPADVFEELIFLSDLNWKRRHFNEDGVQLSLDGFRFSGT